MAATAGLFDILAFGLSLGSDGFLVGDLGTAGVASTVNSRAMRSTIIPGEARPFL